MVKLVIRKKRFNIIVNKVLVKLTLGRDPQTVKTCLDMGYPFLKGIICILKQVIQCIYLVVSQCTIKIPMVDILTPI